jgi:sialate O-acetylesterase
MRRSLLLLTLSLTLHASAELRLPHILSDHAVLQRQSPVRIWGWAAPQENLTVRFHDQTRTTQANAFGEWQLFLNPEPAGGPYTLAVHGDISANSIELHDLLVGDVWLASGQSNMEMPLEGFNKDTTVKNGDQEIAAATQPRIRLLLQSKAISTVPLNDIPNTWTLCTPETARHFSAVAYFFGRELAQKENVPIGLIDVTWGGTPAHAWISTDALAHANLTSVFLDAATIARDQARANEIRDIYKREDVAAKAAGQPAPTHPKVLNDYNGSYTPATLFNAMIAPDTRFTIKGFLWYQGETDASTARAPYYDRVFSTLITDWRNQWGQGDLPFFFVQLSSFGSTGEWGQIRDAQRRTLSLRNTGMAVTLDVGLQHNIHPPDKQTVGHRLALAARATVYGEPIDYLSPTFQQATTEAHAMRVWLTHADGLTSPDATLGGFEVAGEDHKFQPGTATIETLAGHQTILVTSPQVPNPVYVRYNWAAWLTTYLYNAAGLPLGTFTSE